MNSPENFYRKKVALPYGIVIYMYLMDNKQHNLPHIHTRYQGMKASVSLVDGELPNGELPSAKLRLVQAWIEIHRESLLADWELAVSGETPYKIPPLQ